MRNQGCLFAALLVTALIVLETAVLDAAAPTPKGYAVAEINVTDPIAYKKYLTAVTPVVAHVGGKYLIRAGHILPLEGTAPTGRYVVIEFPSLAIAQKFESSPQYRAIAPLRKRASRTRLFLIEGDAN